MNFSKILIAINDTPLAWYGFDVGLTLAAKLGAEVGVVYVVDCSLIMALDTGLSPVGILDDLRSEGRLALDQAKTKSLVSAVNVATILREGSPAKEIVAVAAEWNADLILIATHGRAEVSRLVLGSTAEDILRHSACHVLTVKVPTLQIDREDAVK